MAKKVKKQLSYEAAVRAQKAQATARFYKLNSMLGNKCIFYIILGDRMTGKRYSGAEFLIKQKRELQKYLDENFRNICKPNETKQMLGIYRS